jgi:tetratricopeptide (TPR) repeat protein
LRVVPLQIIRCEWPEKAGPKPALPPLPADWPEPYAGLRGLRYFSTRLAFFSNEERARVLNGFDEAQRCALIADLHAQERESVEQALQDICNAIGVEFVPAYAGDSRLPLHQRFEQELDEARRFHQSDSSRDTFARLMQARARMGLWLDGGSLNRALDAINYFIAICEYELNDHRFYYPYVVKAVCLLNLGMLNEAEEVLLPLHNHSRKDESLYSALGVICYHRSDHAQACHWYSKALAIARSRGEADPAASHGLLTNALQCDLDVNVEGILDELARTELCVPSDQAKILALQAAVHVRRKNFEQACAIYESMLPDLMNHPEILMEYADLLARAETGRKARAVALLEEGKSKHGHIGRLRDRLAMWSFELQDMARAEEHGLQLMADHPTDRRYHMHAAQILRARKQRQARQIAQEVLSAKFGLPATAADFYYCGMANWFLDDIDRADYDFERSGRAREAYYDRLA